MSRIEWGSPGERFFETGVDQVVLYPPAGPGVAWNGVVSIDESVTGGEVEAQYFEGIKVRDVVAFEDFQAQLTAYSSPAEFAICDGTRQLSPGLFVSQQPRRSFGLCYRTLIGNDLQGVDYGYKIHIVYNCTAAPSSQSNKTITNAMSPDTKTWQMSTVPPNALNFKPTAHLVMDSRLIDPYLLQELETVLYGRDASGGLSARGAYLPTVQQILQIMSNKITEPIQATI